MTFSVLVRASAKQDIVRAQEWYEAHAPEQAGRFLEQLGAAIARVGERPLAYRSLRQDARRASMKVFPYAIWYRAHEELGVVEVLALVHDRQDVQRLVDRLE